METFQNYKESSQIGQDLIFTYFKKRMKERRISQKKLAEILEISITTLWRYFKKETPMPLSVLIEICGALKLEIELNPKTK